MIHPGKNQRFIISATSCPLARVAGYLTFWLLLVNTVVYAQTGPAGVGTSANNVLWLDASTLSLANDASVTSWPDQSGNGLDFGPLGVDKATPIFRNDGLASRNYPVVRFDGTERYLRLADNDKLDNNLSGLTILIVSRSNVLDGQARGLLSKRTNASSQESYSVFTYTDSRLYFDTHNGNDNRLASPTTLNTTTDYLHSLRFDGTTQNVHVQSTSAGSRTVNGNGGVSNTTSDLILGALNENYNRYFDGDIAELIIYNEALSDADRLTIENYLSQKYGITITHDFFGNAAGYDPGYTYDLRGIGSDGTGTRSLSQASGGLTLREKDGSLDAGEYVMLAHNNAPHDDGEIRNRVDEVSITARWARDWYVEVNRGGGSSGVNNGEVSVEMVFDFEADATLNYSGSPDDYVLLYRSTSTGNFDRVYASSYKTEGTNQLVATVPASRLQTGYYTLGTGTPLLAKTWYSYQDGDWSDHETWTLDGAAFPADENPGKEVPGAQDDVIITSGSRVSIRTDGKQVSYTEVVGDLDITTSTGHDLGSITGNGRILVAGDASGNDNFPAGNSTGFADATDGGTVVLYGNGFSLDQPRTFNHLQVALAGSSNEATLLNNYTLNGNLAVENGTFKINGDAATDNLTMGVYGDVTVNSTGQIGVSASTARHQLNLYGNLINDGTMAFTNRTAPDYTQEAANGIVDVNFLNGAQDQRLECNGPSTFYRIEIDKGVDDNYELLMVASEAGNFRLWGYAYETHPQVAQLTNNNNALGLVRGTVRIGNHIRIPYLNNRANNGGNYNISAGAQLWVDGGYVAKKFGTAIVTYGTARVSAGTLEAPINSGFTLRDNGTILVEGTGVLNTNQIRTSVLGAGSLGGYIQRGGQTNLLGDNTNNDYTTNGDYYVFNLTYPGNVFVMTGGELNVKKSRGKGGIFINSRPENIEVTEGTVNLEIGDNRDMVVTSRAPFYNVNMRNPAGNNRQIILRGAVDVSSTNVDLAAQPLVVLNNLTLEEGTHFKTNGQDVTIGRNFTVEDRAVYEFEGNTTLFNSDKSASLYVGDITEVTNPSYTDPEGNNPYERWEHPFNNLTINKPGATLTFAAKDPGSTGNNNDIETPSGGKNVFRNKSNLVKVIGDFTLEAGTLDIDRYSLRLYGGNVTNKGTLGLYTEGVSSPDAIVKFRKSGGNFTINTVAGSTFGNLRINSGGSNVTFTSDVYVKRLEYRHGRVYIGTHNLKIDQLDINLENNETQTSDGNRIFSTEDMLVTAGNASDGGLSLYVPNPLPNAIRTYNEYTAAGQNNETNNDVYNQPDELWFPIGTEANSTPRYTPAVVKLSDVTDDGYITINPVDEVLGTTNIAGGELLSYYWQVDHSDFETLPTVQYRFSYDSQDTDGGNASNWVAGKVLSQNPFTRSGEDFTDSDGSGTLDVGEGTADLASVDESNAVIVFDGIGNGGFSLEQAKYTAGEVDRFTGQVEVYYSRKSYSCGNCYNSGAPKWTEADSWATGSHEGPVAADYPREGDVAIIGGSNGQRRPISIRDGNTVMVAQTVINSVAGDVRLYVENTATADLGIVEGDGTIQYYVSETNIPAVTGDFGAFANNHENGSEFLYYGNGGTDIMLPSTPTVYPDVRIEGNSNRNFRFPVEVAIKDDLTVDNQATLWVNADIVIEDDLKLGGFKQGSLRFPTDVARTVTIKDRLRTQVNNGNGSGTISVDNSTPSALKHRLIVEGDIEHRNGTIDLFSDNTGGNNAILELAGEHSHRFFKGNGIDRPDFYRIVINKGVNQDSTFTFEDEFNLLGATDDTPKALELQNGTLILDDPDIDINLTTGGDNFLIPSTAALEVRNGRVNASGNNTGILLAGTLRLNGSNARVDMSDNIGNGNNYIEYSVGNPTLEILDGTLTVGSQIRRVLNDDSGVLDYQQTGGRVTIGRQAIDIPRPAPGPDPETVRGMLEVVNGGTFVHTGGELKIARSNNSASVAALFLEPGTYDVNGSDIVLGDGNSPEDEIYGINSSIPLHTLTVNNASNKNPKALLFVRPLTVNNTLTITPGATLDAGSTNLALTLNGDLINNGTYLPRENTTIFGSSTTQTISGANPTDFYDLEKTNTGTLTLNQPMIVEHDLRVLSGTVADNGNAIEVRGDVTHDAIHTSAGGQGIVFAGTSPQQLRRSATGSSTFGVLTVRNSQGVSIPETNGFNFTITERLRLDDGVLNIGSSSLTLEENATVEAVNPFGLTNMVRTNSSFADAGLKKVFSAGAATNFVFPVGEDVYSPVTVDFASVGGSIGTSRGAIAVIPNRRYHPVVNDGVESTLPTDSANVLQYYWAVRTETLTNFTGNLIFAYDQSDVALGTDAGGDPFLESEYIAARILTLGANTSVDKFTPVDEVNNRVTFKFVGVNNGNVYGDYFCGIDPAIPADIPVFTSTGSSSAYDDPNAWTIVPTTLPFPAGGPQGSSVIVIKTGHTIDFDRDGIEVYKTELEAGATLNLNATGRHNLGIVSGQGSLYTETGSLPAGFYGNFFTCTGGEVNYGGTASSNYSVFKGGIATLRKVTFSGSGQRTMPNTTGVTICEDMVIDGPTVTNPNGSGTDNITVGNDLLIQAGTFRTGNSTLTVGSDLVVQGTYDGQSNHRNTVNGNVTIDGGTFRAGNNSIIGIGGNLSKPSGNFTSGTSRLVMQGSTLQTITGTFTGAADMNRLEINNGAGVALAASSPVDIDTELILRNGVLTPGTSKLLLDADAAVGPSKIGSATAYVNGTLCKIIVNSEEFVFPVGKGSRWGYASVDPNPNDSHEWCVEYFDEVATNNALISNLNPSVSAALTPNNIRTISQNEYWRIEDNASGVPALIGLRWDGKSDVSADQNDWYHLKVMEWRGTDIPAAWDARGGTGHLSNPVPTQNHGFFRAVAPITFSEKFVTMGSSSENNALPVELLSFKAVAQAQSVQLVWETASEIDNDYFEVLRSVDGITFTKVGEVAGAGNSSELLRYEFTDKLPLDGVSYYQLKQVDYNGMYEYSDKISVEWTSGEATDSFVELHVYPNPTSQGYTKLKATGISAHNVVTVRLLDMFGKVRLQRVLKSDELVRNGYLLKPAGVLSTGVYIITLQQGATVVQKTLIVR